MTSTLDHVRDGVRRFILSDASIGDFHKALRSAVRTGKLSPNPLTGSALRKIVKEAIDERKSMAKKRNKRKQTEKESRNAKTSNRHH
jgi:hypothetical protein